MYGTLLAEHCFKDEEMLQENGGGGVVRVPREMLQGKYELVLGFERPDARARYDVFVSEEGDIREGGEGGVAVA